MNARTMKNKPLEKRLRAGRGALVLHGKFWYPALVIQSHDSKAWLVRWWRGCQFDSHDGIEPESRSVVSLGKIVDSLWLKQAERRQIRVSLIDFSCPKGNSHCTALAREMDTRA
jgi:hypothetical protein